MRAHKILLILAWIGCVAGPAVAAEPSRVLIVPFTINADRDLSFLQAGIRDMLTSRLAIKDRLEVMSASYSQKALEMAEGQNTPDRLRAIGRDLNADYVMHGSITSLGGSVSLDARVLDVAQGSVVATFSDHVPSMDQLIGKVDELAQHVKQNLFEEGGAFPSPEPSAESQEARESESGAPVAQSVLSPTYFLSPSDRIQTSYLNPSFRPGEEGREVVWKSRMFPFNVKGFDIGDVDGDKKNELVLITDREVRAYDFREGGLGEAAQFKIGAFNTLISVDVADLNEDGIAEIYVVNETGTTGDVNSLVLEMQAGRLVPVIEGCPFLFRVIKDPGTGKPMLVGQRKNLQGLIPGIYKLRRTPTGIVEDENLDLPKHLTVFSFALSDLNNDGHTRIVAINGDEFLEVKSMSGDSLWESDYYFGGTLNRITLQEENAFTTEVGEYKYIPARIIVADLDKDRIPEIIVNRNKSTTFRLTSRYKHFSGCNMVSLSWRGVGLVENWSTVRIPGYVPDYQLRDLNSDGHDDLVVVTVNLDPAGIRPAKSTFVSFSLATDSG